MNNRTGPASKYLCGHHTLLAHGQAYRLYHAPQPQLGNKSYSEVQHSGLGQIGMALNVGGVVPATEGNPQDEAAVDVTYEAQLGWMADPAIYGE